MSNSSTLKNSFGHPRKTSLSPAALKWKVLRQLYSAQVRSKTLESYADHSRKRRESLEKLLIAVCFALTKPISPKRIEQFRQTLVKILAARQGKTVSEVYGSHSVHNWIMGDHEEWNLPLMRTSLMLELSQATRQLQTRIQTNKNLLEQVLDNELNELKLHNRLEDEIRKLQERPRLRNGHCFSSEGNNEHKIVLAPRVSIDVRQRERKTAQHSNSDKGRTEHGKSVFSKRGVQMSVIVGAACIIMQGIIRMKCKNQ